MPQREAMAAVPYHGELAPIAAEVTDQVVRLWHAEGVLTAHHETPFGELPGAVVLNFAVVDAAAHAWDLSASLGRAIEFPAEWIPRMTGVVELTCTEHAVELGLVEPPTEPPTGRHRDPAPDGRGGQDHPGLTVPGGDVEGRRRAPLHRPDDTKPQVTRRGGRVEHGPARSLLAGRRPGQISAAGPRGRRRVPRSSPSTTRTCEGTRMANSIIGRDMAVDLGTANTLVYVRGRGIMLDEPSVVALNDTTGEVLAVGHEAKRMIGRTPDNITALRPMKDGVIADFEATEQMLRFFIQQVHRRRYFTKPRMVICVPSGITAVEQRAVKEAGYQAGARKVYIIEEPMAAAIGAGLPVHQAAGNMVVDVGGGTTEVAVISLGGVVTSLSIRTAGDDLDTAIVAWMKKEYSLMLGERTAEEVKMTLGSAFPTHEEPEAEIRGRDMISGLPRSVVVSSAEVRKALEEPLHAIVDAVRSTLDSTPPELAGDIMDRGIVLTGGGALLRGLDERLRHETGMPVHVAEDPLSSVAMGAGKCVEEFEGLQQVLVSERRRY